MYPVGFISAHHHAIYQQNSSGPYIFSMYYPWVQHLYVTRAPDMQIIPMFATTKISHEILPAMLIDVARSAETYAK